MKPNTQQKELLSKYLRDNLKYRETYTEFYDHILSALESQTTTMPFQDAVNQIIKEDFDGLKGMALIESKYQKAVFEEMKDKYLTYAAQYIKTPLIGVTVMLSVIFYVMTSQPWFNLKTFILIALIVRFIPFILKGVRHFKTGYIFKDIKTSVKDRFFWRLDYFAGFLLFPLCLTRPASFLSPVTWFNNGHPIIISIILILFTMHALLFYKVYHDEFETSITR